MTKPVRGWRESDCKQTPTGTGQRGTSHKNGFANMSPVSRTVLILREGDPLKADLAGGCPSGHPRPLKTIIWPPRSRRGRLHQCVKCHCPLDSPSACTTWLPGPSEVSKEVFFFFKFNFFLAKLFSLWPHLGLSEGRLARLGEAPHRTPSLSRPRPPPSAHHPGPLPPALPSHKTLSHSKLPAWFVFLRKQ